MKSSSESAIAIPTPRSTPSTATPANATIASTNSERRQLRSRRAAATSMNPSTATMTIAASVDSGRSCTRPVPKIRSSGQDAGAGEAGELAASADVLGDRRARAAGGDREALEEAGREVRDAEDRELLVLVDLLAQPPGVAARQDARVGERDERDADRRGDAAS